MSRKPRANYIAAEHYLSADGQMWIVFCTTEYVAEEVRSMADGGMGVNPSAIIRVNSQLGRRLKAFFPNAAVVTMKALRAAGLNEEGDLGDNCEELVISAQECLDDENPNTEEGRLKHDVAIETDSTRYLADADEFEEGDEI
jgi:hypothetical protein